MPKPRFSKFVPPVPPTIDGSHGIEKSLLAISMCMQLLHSPTPICRYTMANGFYLRLKVKYLSTPPRSNGLRDFAILLRNFKSSILFLLKSPSLRSFSCSNFSWSLFPGNHKGLSLLRFVNSDSLGDFARTACAQPSTTFKVLKSSASVHSPAIEISGFLPQTNC
jgi:hypothetical protein